MKHSTLVKKINEGADVGQTAKQELPKWNKAKDKDTGQKKVMKGLTNRRNEEAELMQK